MSKKNKKKEAVNEPKKADVNETAKNEVVNDTIEQKLQVEVKNEKDKFLI